MNRLLLIINTMHAIKSKLSTFLFILIFHVVVHDSMPKLIYVAAQFRHGARYPLSANYDIYDSNQTKPFSGRLTTVGMRQLYLLGSYIKADYVDKQKIINATLYTKEIQIFSSSSQRCMESAGAFGVGLFPFAQGEKLPANISQDYLKPPYTSLFTQNIRNIQSLQKTQQSDQFALNLGFQPTPSTVNNFFFRCSSQDQIISSRLQSLQSRLTDFQATHQPFIQRIKGILSLKPEYTNLIGLLDVHDLITGDMYLGRKLPDQWTSQDYRTLDYIQAWVFTLVYSDHVSAVFSTNILSYILNNMNNIIKKGKDQPIKMSIFSGHDSNIVPLLTYLNLTSPECLTARYNKQSVSCAQVVPFASNIVFELHSDDNNEGKYYVKVKYNGQYYALCQKNNTQCDYQEFEARVKTRFINFQKQCPNTNPTTHLHFREEMQAKKIKIVTDSR